jgi:hypothetical protein
MTCDICHAYAELPTTTLSVTNKMTVDRQHERTTPMFHFGLVTTAALAALAVRIILLQRRRVTLLDSSAPPRRLGQTPAQFSRALRGPRSEPTLISEKCLRDSVIDEGASGNFNAALYGAKALGIATLLVGVGSTATIWGLKTTFGIQDVRLSSERLSEPFIHPCSCKDQRLCGSHAPQRSYTCTCSIITDTPIT